MRALAITIVAGLACCTTPQSLTSQADHQTIAPVAPPPPPAKDCESQLTDARRRCAATIREREGVSFSWTVTKPGEFQLSVLPPFEGKWTLSAGLRVKDAVGAVLLDAEGELAPLSRRLTVKAGAYQLTVFPSDGFMAAHGHVFDLEVWALSEGEPPAPQLPERRKRASTKPALRCTLEECISLGADELARSAKSKQPEAAFATAAVFVSQSCDRDHDDRACAFAQQLTSALAEFKANAQADVARKVLHARRCTWALGWDDMKIDAPTRIGEWCPQAFDGCRVGLMAEVAHAFPIDRTAVVGSLCMERLCSTPDKPKDCTRRGDRVTRSEVLALLKLTFERGLPAPVATELHRAFSAPRHLFFE